MLYLMRHGLDDERYVGGWSEASLTDIGKSQVRGSLTKLETLKLKQIVSSDIKRSSETARIIGGYLNLPITFDKRFRELNKGIVTGLPKETAERLFPTKNLTIADRYPNGESMLDLYYRIRDNLNVIMAMDDTLIVTHRGIINMLYYLLNDIPLDMHKERFNVIHASIHEVNAKEKIIRRVY